MMYRESRYINVDAGGVRNPRVESLFPMVASIGVWGQHKTDQNIKVGECPTARALDVCGLWKHVQLGRQE